jgi:hypothetical protein
MRAATAFVATATLLATAATVSAGGGPPTMCPGQPSFRSGSGSVPGVVSAGTCDIQQVSSPPSNAPVSGVAPDLKAGPDAPAAHEVGAATVYATAGAYTYTVPRGIGHLLVELRGGGGGGSGASCYVGTGDCYAGAGGGQGGYVQAWIAVTPGAQLTVSVGAGGAGGSGQLNSSGDPGSAGGSTTLGAGGTTFASASGGGGGQSSSAAGAGGTAAVYAGAVGLNALPGAAGATTSGYEPPPGGGVAGFAGSGGSGATGENTSTCVTSMCTPPDGGPGAPGMALVLAEP